MLVHEVLSRKLRDRRAVARYAGLTGAPTESGSKRRDARGIALSQYFCPTAKLGTGSFYFGTFHDHSGKPLEGQKTYRLHVPANVPVAIFGLRRSIV